MTTLLFLLFYNIWDVFYLFTHFIRVFKYCRITSELVKVMGVNTFIDVVFVFKWTKYCLKQEFEESFVQNYGVQHCPYKFWVCVCIWTLTSIRTKLDIREVLALFLFEVVWVEKYFNFVMWKCTIVTFNTFRIANHVCTHFTTIIKCLFYVVLVSWRNQFASIVLVGMVLNALEMIMFD